MKLIIRLLVFSILLFFLQIYPVSAAENFLTDYDVTYTVKEDGQTHADMKVTLTNAASDYSYASSYKVALGFSHLSNISVKDLGGIITPQIEKTNSGYTIELEFNKKIVGIGNKQIFTVQFDTTDIAQKQGKIWEINIPGIEDEKSFKSFNVHLKVPNGFGEPAYVKPCITSNPNNRIIQPKSTSECSKDLSFSKEQLAKSGISLAFGSEQQFSFTLLYHLQNKNLFPIRTEIALPPNTNYQEVILDSLIPEPVQVRQDVDGNWLAEYELRATQEVDIKAKGRVNIRLFPKFAPATQEEQAQYLQDKPYWQKSNTQVKELAKTLTTPEAIFQYVVNHLSYDFSRITSSNNRLGAAGVLEKPSSAVCLEFTDLFIALARAAGIPAREVDGFAYTENPRQRPLSLVQDILHAWPEYYDKDRQTWIMVDPTWTSTTGGVDYFTTLDFDHFAFVKKGVSSTYPVPAGGYKVAGEENRKDVFVWSTTDEFVKENDVSLSSTLKNTYSAGIPIEGRITVVNKGPKVSKYNQLLVTADELSPSEQIIAVGTLLPFEKKEVVFHFEKQDFLTNKSYIITMNLADKEYRKKVTIVPIFIEHGKLIGGIIGVIFSVIILITSLKARRIRISR